MKKNVKHFILTLLIGILSVACSQNKVVLPSVDFAPYISAYSGGLISNRSSVRIEFTQDIPKVELQTALKDNLFDFSPSIKGKTYWINNRVVEFVPDPGQLKAGTLYNGAFKLGKVMDVKKDFKTFPFSFQVIPPHFSIETVSVIISADNSKVASVEGTLQFSDQTEIETVKANLSAALEGGKSFPVDVLPSNNNESFHFSVTNIPRPKEDQNFVVKLDGKSIGVSGSVEDRVLIPGTNPFRVMSVNTINSPENGIEIVFSEPVSKTQDLRGLITIPEVSGLALQVENNIVRAFFDLSNASTITVNINKGLKSVDKESLIQSYTYSLAIESLNPAVSISSSAFILPDSKNLTLSFRSVNLWAVDLKVIQVFEKNVLMFMQTNTLDGNNELRRSGRLIYKKTIRLDSDPKIKLNRWNNYSLDLSEIIKQEPGAIYRIIMTFKKEYATYPCGKEMPARGHDLTSSSSSNPSEEDEAEWDALQTYYWEGNDNYDWNEYNWNDRNDPCKPTYYMLQENTMVSCNVLASNFGIIVKGNSDKKLWIAVSDILTTQPVRDAEVKAYNFQLQVIGSAKTDANGFASFDLTGKPFVVTAESGQQKAYLRVPDGEEKSTSRFDTGGKSTQKGLKGFIYGERGVWRPGDTLHVSFIVEDRTKKWPDNHPVTMELYNPQGQFYTKMISTMGENGFYVFQIPTNPDDPTGVWNLYTKAGGASFHKSMRIETVKPNRLKVILDVPGERMDASSGSIHAKLSSHWLTGATARGLKATVEMSMTSVRTSFKGFDKYIFDNPITRFSSEQSEVFDGKLDETGKAIFDINMPQTKSAPGLLQATIVSRVFEPGGDVSSFVQSMSVSPFEYYVGINFNQKDGYWYQDFDTDEEHIFDIVTVDADGKPVSRQSLDFRVYKLNWSWWWQRNNESFESYVNNNSVQPVMSKTLNTPGGKASVKFRIDYPEWGRYLVYIKDKESGHATGRIIYLDWPAYRGRSNKNDPSATTMLTFSTDKQNYKSGEKATVIIPSAAPGKALVALETGTSVLKREWVDVGASDTKYTFDVTEDMAPNFYVHVTLLQPHAQTVNNSPIRMYGVIPVFVDNPESKLEPLIDMPDALRPEEEFTLKIKEKSGKKMTYTLAIVDDGLLDLTGFKTPDPWNEFYAREALGIRTWDMYDYVIGAYGNAFSAMLSIGGDEDSKPVNKKANRFKPVVHFIGPVTLEKGKVQTHKIKLPMYVGSVRTMVVAGYEAAYGKAEKTVTVKNPVMILPTLPRVVSAGEKIVLPVNVFAMEDNVKDVKVKVEISAGLMKLSGDNTKTVKFSAPGDDMTYFELNVGANTGVEKVKISATGGGFTATETIEIDVRNPNPPMITNIDKLLRASEEAEFEYDLIDRSDKNWVKMEISRIPSIDLNRRFDYLENYMHCCTEQLSSKGFPLLYVEDFKNLTDVEKETTKKNIKEVIRLLYGRQLNDGGFVYWPGSNTAEDWISSYAGHFLLEARSKGYDVNQNVINKWVAYQKKVARNWTYEYYPTSRYSYYQNDLQQAYRLYTLALAGSPEAGAMNRLKEIKNLSSQASWRLAAAFAIDGKKTAAGELIFNVKTVIDGYTLSNATYGSSYRDEAMILETMVLMGDMQKAFEQAKKVSKNLASEYYFSTQNTAYSLLAMGKLASKVEKGMIEADWKLNGKKQPDIRTAKPVHQVEIPTNVMSGKVTLKNASKGDLFVSFTAKSQPVNDTLPEVANNIRLEVTYTDLNGNPVSISQIPQGTDFIAIVKISNISGNNSYTDLALTHIIPSGWEIFNERMMEGVGTKSEAYYTYRDIRDDRVLTYFDLSRSSAKVFRIRMQAAYRGEFVLPAIQCEAMYDTQVQARTRSGMTRVTEE